jgi:hypothetical protein
MVFKGKNDMKFNIIAPVVLGSVLAVSTAQAGLLQSNVAYGLADAQAAEAAFLAGSYSYVTEDFNGLAGTQVIGSNAQSSWENSASSFNTAAGLFTVTTGAVQTGDDVDLGELKIESNVTGEFGRDTGKADGDLWLDSNDVEQVTWTFLDVNTTFDSLGFYLVDANDRGANLVLSYVDGSTETIAINSPLANGNVAYVSLVADTALVGATMIFDNNGRNDGWAIDNVTVAKVPEPATFAMLGLGLLGLAASRKRKVS